MPKQDDTDYLFCSARLGFRVWRETDLDALTALNANPEVMRYFPGTLTREESAGFLRRMMASQEEDGFCYFAAELRATGTWVGFIGLLRQTYPAPFTPCVDIGWRLLPAAWGQGIATEGATACLAYGFDVLGLPEIVAVTPQLNQPSIRVMEKSGMRYWLTFDHPKIAVDSPLRTCVVYRSIAGQRY